MKPLNPCSRRAALAGLASLPILANEACSQAAPRASASILDYLPSSEHRGIAAGTSDFDCAPALQRAIDETADKGTVLILPSGRYVVVPNARLDHADPNFVCHAALLMRSGMHLRGEQGASIQIARGISSDAAPRAMAMFGTDAQLRQVVIENLSLDMNGRSNPMSPGRGRGAYSRAPQAHIFVSGRPKGPAARIDAATITGCRFTDSNGVSCIVMAQTDRNERLGRGWRIRDCTFAENGGDTDDHSSIYAWADDVTIEGCTFTNRRAFERTGGNTCYEVHGSNQTLSGNRFHNYLRGIWVANNVTQTSLHTRIVGNSFATMFCGVDFFRNTDKAFPIGDTEISGNRFVFDDAGMRAVPQINLKAAVQIASEYAQSGILVRKNTVRKSGTGVACAFVVVTGGAAGRDRHDRITVTENEGDGLTFGSFLRTTPTAGLGTIVITRNNWKNLTPAGAYAIPAGDSVEQTQRAQPIRSLTLGGGSVIDTRRMQRPTHAVAINGTIQELVLSPVDLRGGMVLPLVMGGTGRVVRKQGALKAP